jgi:aminoglycoside phosphotransferase (APT) family kinase protein
MVRPEEVAAHYGSALASVRWVGHGGGFSGADIFAGFLGDSPDPVFCLKAFPPAALTAERLGAVHAHMQRAAHLRFIPRVYPTVAGATVVEHDDRLWELTTWLPGAADFRKQPSDARLSAAGRAIAALHQAWQPAERSLAAFPAVARRLAVLREWRRMDPPPRTDLPLADITLQAATILPAAAAEAERLLAPWAGRSVGVQPCLCDVHHDHVLFTGEAVTGIIDFAAMKLDHPAVDLARLLGDLVGDEVARLRLGLAAYHQAGGSADVTEELVRLLDHTGTVCAVANWLLRLAAGKRPADWEVVAARLKRLLRRLEQPVRWQ